MQTSDSWEIRPVRKAGRCETHAVPPVALRKFLTCCPLQPLLNGLPPLTKVSSTSTRLSSQFLVVAVYPGSVRFIRFSAVDLQNSRTHIAMLEIQTDRNGFLRLMLANTHLALSRIDSSTDPDNHQEFVRFRHCHLPSHLWSRRGVYTQWKMYDFDIISFFLPFLL